MECVIESWLLFYIFLFLEIWQRKTSKFLFKFHNMVLLGVCGPRDNPIWLVFCFLCLFTMKFIIFTTCKISIYTIRFGLRLFYKVIPVSYKDTIWLLWTHTLSELYNFVFMHSTTLCPCMKFRLILQGAVWGKYNRERKFSFHQFKSTHPPPQSI